MQSTSGQNTMTIKLKTTATTANEIAGKTFTDTGLTEYIGEGSSLRMGDIASYDKLVGSLTITRSGLRYAITTKDLKFVDGAGNIYQITDGSYDLTSFDPGKISTGGGIW